MKHKEKQMELLLWKKLVSNLFKQLCQSSTVFSKLKLYTVSDPFDFFGLEGTVLFMRLRTSVGYAANANAQVRRARKV